MNTQKPIYLMAGGRNSKSQEPIFESIFKDIGKIKPTVAYVGVANGDNWGFYLRISRMIENAGECKVRRVTIAPNKSDLNKARATLESSDAIFMSGGDVEAGMQVLKEKKLIGSFVDLFQQGKLYIGTSAGVNKYTSKQVTSGATWSELETNVNGDSASGQKILNVASSTGFQAGDLLILNTGGARQEVCTVASTGAGTITMVGDLQFTHTAGQADKVNHDYTGGASPATTNALTEEIKVAQLGPLRCPRKSATTCSMTLTMVEQF